MDTGRRYARPAKMTIRKMREAKGLSQGQLARALGITSVAVSYWEAGVQNPSADKLPKLAAILGCSIDDLFDLAAYGPEVNRLDTEAS